MFKKKSLKFTYEKVSRDIRHAETLKARESSRFKRLSMIRSINDSNFIEESMETPKENKCKAPEKKPSRLEMLFKWKQEKQIKKEMEKLAKKKPFYTGGNKNVIESKPSQSFKSSFIAQSNSSFNSSKFAKSKLVTPSVEPKPSRILNPKQGIPSSIAQSKVTNVKQGVSTSTFQSSRIPNSKQGTPSAIPQSSKIPNSKQTLLPKTGSNLSRSNSTATSRKLPTTSDKTSKPGSTLSRSNSTATVSRKFANLSTTDKVAASKAVSNNQRAPLLNKVLNNCAKSANTLKSKNLSKFVCKGSSEPKSSESSEKSIKKAGIGLPKVASSVTTVSKGIPVQNKLPVSSLNKKFESNTKLNKKDTLQSENNVSLRKGYCFRTAVSNSIRQQADTVLKTPFQGTPKKQQHKTSKNVEENSSIKEFPEQSLDSIPDVTFNSDISIIKPARQSFAPANFTFQPPEGLNNFVFDDDDCDVYQTLEEIKLKFMSRTSTPSKDSERKSSIKSSKESLGNNLMAGIEKSDLSNSDDLSISELMTPVSFKIKIEDEKLNEISNKETSNEVVCDVITNINSKEMDIGINQQVYDEVTSVSPIRITVKEAEVIGDQENKKVASPTAYLEVGIIADQDNEVNSFLPDKITVKEPDSNIKQKNQEVAPIFPVKTVDEEAKVSSNQESSEMCLSSLAIIDVKVDKIINQQINDKLVSDLNADLTNAETVEKDNKNESQEKQVLNCSNVIENPKTDSTEVNSNEAHFTHLFKNGISETSSGDIDFFDNDESLLDSIDLNKIQLMKLDDEDSDKDDFPSPQPPKCAERKSNGTTAKRVSILKNLSVMNSIAETVETDECLPINSAKSSKSNRNAPRRSKRISNLISLDMLSESPLKNSGDSPSFTPRRSLRLKNASATIDNCSISPFKEKNASNVNTRQSMRLIDLSTPEKAASEKLLGDNLENFDPNNFLIDFESPSTPTLSKSKKVSLLYSPEKRKSIRRSIRGDLISFSPA